MVDFHYSTDARFEMFMFIIIIVAIAYIIVEMPKRVCHDIVEIHTDYNNPTDFPLSAKIICEEGYEVDQYFNKQTIYGCLKLINGVCSGYGKTCFIKETKCVFE